jgi:hypothetical protein
MPVIPMDEKPCYLMIAGGGFSMDGSDQPQPMESLFDFSLIESQLR